MANLILANYTFASGTPMPGVIVRGYACGRYVGSSTNPSPAIVIGNQVNLNALFSLVVPMPQAVNIPLAWCIQTHFYFSSTVPDAGVACSVGSNIRMTVTIPNQSSLGAQYTGGQVLTDVFGVQSNPYNTPVPAGQTTQLAYAFVSVQGTDTWEVHTAYLEAL